VLFDLQHFCGVSVFASSIGKRKHYYSEETRFGRCTVSNALTYLSSGGTSLHVVILVIEVIVEPQVILALIFIPLK
jgi:hypothetical protein